MKRYLLTLNLMLLAIVVFGQSNMTMLSNYTYAQRTIDIWAYVDEQGNEYAILGLEQGVSIVNVTNPNSVNEVFYTSGFPSGWRDVKVYGDTAYITNEGSEGLMMIDLSPLPQDSNLMVGNYTGNMNTFSSAHNLFIDEYGFAYVFGAKDNNADVGTVILNLNYTPMDSAFEVGVFNDFYLHDGMARGDTLWGAAIEEGYFAAIDVSDKSAMNVMATKYTPNNFAHNCWISDDGTTLFTTDEVSGAFVASYDVSDLGNITELDRIQSNPGSGVIPHNTHFINDYVVTSYYKDGVTIHDVSNPSSMVEVGNYDTHPGSGDGFSGCWGTYPWLPSGNVLASDMQTGLYVFGVNYIRACHLKGNVTNMNTAGPLDGVDVTILGENLNTNTNIAGNYIMGTAVAGMFDVVYSKDGFFPDTITVNLINDSTLVVDVQLTPFPTYEFSGEVKDAVTLLPISGATVHIVDSINDITLTTDLNGDFSVSDLSLGTYQVTIGVWGHKSQCFELMADNDSTGVEIYLTEGYYDDFSFDFGWTVSGNADDGAWERDNPVRINLGPYEISPEDDVDTDCKDLCFITGNNGVNPGEDELDSSLTVLSSPLFDVTSYTNPTIRFSRWFYTGFGASQDDQMVFKLSNGITEVELVAIDVNDGSLSTWVDHAYTISDFIVPTNQMQLIVEIGDLGEANITEGAFDKFEVVDIPLGLETNYEVELEMYPNPFKDVFFVSSKSPITSIEVFDVTGKQLEVNLTGSTNQTKIEGRFKPGIYFVKLWSGNNLIDTQKLICQ